MSDDKLGVFICTGYGIEDALDMDEIESVATGEYNADVYETFESYEGEGLVALSEQIAAAGVNKAIVAGPSGRLFGARDFPAGVVMEFVNLLDLVVLTHKDLEDEDELDEDMTAMAQDYLRMACVRIQAATEVVPFEESAQIDKTILVVGGGIAGLSAAVETAKAGYDVVLIEKDEVLGGYMNKVHRSVPHTAPYRDLEDTGIATLVEAVNASDKITVHTGTTITQTLGGPGLFDVTLANGTEFRAGAIVQATGFTPIDPTGFDHLGFGKVANVITNDQFEAMASNGGFKRPDGQPAKSVAFVQCGDSRNPDSFSYSSAIMSLNALKQAIYLREADPEARAYVFYEHIKTPGQHEDFYKRVQEDPGVFMTRGMVTNVEDAGGSLVVDVDDTMLGDQIQVELDLLVLNAGMKPNSADGEAIRQHTDMSKVLEEGPENAKYEEAVKVVEELGEHAGSEILNLDYRQGPDMPTLRHGYPDSHFICFPYETRRTGIYAAGALRSPMDSASAVEDAMGAALKAIQCVEMLSRGETVHPRSGDVSFPDFALMRCTQCKRCTEECPFGTINEDEKGTPEYNVTRCRRCGICLGACPERIINFPDYSVGAVANMIKAVEVPEEWDEKPRVLALCCENDALPALEAAAQHGTQYSLHVRVIPVRCLGSINVVWIKECISNGFDGVLMFGCKHGDDYQCHYIKGSELMDARGKNVKETLESMSMENERVALHQVEIDDHETIPKVIDEFMELIEEIGMNPFKGM